MPTFEHLFNNRVRSHTLLPPPQSLGSFDPGATTGVAIYRGIRLHKAAQLNTSDPEQALASFSDFFAEGQFTEVVMEDYRVYANRIEQHAGSSLQTPRLIGMLETLCMQRKIPFHKQPAGVAKQFCTDLKLKEWGMYAPGQRHARDAIRHATYYILFPPKTRTSDNIRQVTLGKKGSAGQHVG